MSEAEALIRELVHFVTHTREYDEDEKIGLFIHVDDYLTRCTAARAHQHGKLAVIQGGKR